MRRLLLGAALAGGMTIAGLLAGCGSAAEVVPPAGTHADLHPNIIPNAQGTMPDAFYLPNPIRVHVGQTITWTNKDNDLHDVTEVNGLFASYPLTLGGTFRWTPTRPGTYPYFCTLHPEMHGIIIVT